MTPESRSRSKGRLALRGSVLRREESPEAMNAAKLYFVIGASAPPAIASSASPDLIMLAARSIASSPEGQADETVAAWAQAPIRSARALAAACGARALRVIGETPSGPRRSKLPNSRSITSIALVETPITTGVGLGQSLVSVI